MTEHRHSADDGNPPIDFGVLTLNLRFGLADDGPNSWRYRKMGFPSLFNMYRPDFIGLQEANDFQIEFINEILNEYGYIGKRSPAPSFWQNNVIFYQKIWTSIDARHFFLSPTPQIPSRFRESRWPRQCTVGLFEDGRHRLICINTHFDFDASVQKKSACLILEYLSDLPADVPAILMGDFNATPSQSCHEILTRKSHDVPMQGSSFQNIFTKTFPGTYHGFSGNPEGNHIDWILYRGRIVPSEKKVIRETFEGIYPSDHFPVYARFRWQESGR
jgi:endonuclease/exonuclease/phosphatase family metal-dependent hydrolase